MEAFRATGSQRQPVRLTLYDDSAASRERELIERARSGDREAFGELIRAHLGDAVRLAMRVVHDEHDAEDVAQDAFLLALRRLDTFDTRRAFRPWLLRIVVNRAIDFAESRRIRSAELLSPDARDASALPDAKAQHADLVAHVQRVLAGLPPRQRLVIQLSDIDGASISDIAELTGSAQATVRWHLHMGRRALRAALSPLFGENA